MKNISALLKIDCIRNSTTWTSISVVGAALILSGCFQPGAPKPVGLIGSDSNGSKTASGSNGGGSSASVDSYKASYSTKVIFNKNHFYTNQNYNSQGCAGDARHYFDPLQDRIAPVKPDFIKNVSVELTNSNAFYGPSLASGCGLSGTYAPPAANCAFFDDGQPTDGSANRTILIGGYGCDQGVTSCSANHILADSWHLYTSDVSTAASWYGQSSNVPVISGVAGAFPGVAWAAGDYDEIHDQFYIFGGATPNTTTNSSTAIFSNSVIKMSYAADSSLSTSPSPALMTASSNRYYGGWNKTGAVDAALAGKFPPPAMVGSTFTYSPRRDPAIASRCKLGDPLTGMTCNSNDSTLSASGSRIANNAHSDYFLLTGGMQTSGLFNSDIYIYKPHGYSSDVGTAVTAVPVTSGDWNLVSNVTSAALSSQIMRVVDLYYGSGSTTSPISMTTVGNTRIEGDVFSGWTGRAFHQTTYDPSMNRFYIFGGVVNNLAVNPATTTAPDLATTDVWVYDPPALGRRPTAACFTTLAPDGTSLPATTNIMGAQQYLKEDRAFLSSKYVFPPGGCLQRIKLSTTPSSRFLHSMTFDRDQKAMVVFGGCKSTSTVTGNGVAGAGSGISNCNNAGSLLNDLWVYLPPTVTEVVPNTYSVSGTNPYSSTTTSIPNIFGTNFWIDHFPMFYGDNNPINGAITQPRSDQLLGTWISLSPTTKPTPRLGGTLTYDRAHHKVYLNGGYGCDDSTCSTSPHALNDTWELTLPDFADSSQCSREGAYCNSSYQGTWTKIKSDVDASATSQPTRRFGAVAAFANNASTFNDDYYTVSDSSCIAQGPIASSDATVNRQYVGAIYVDVDRSRMSSSENLVINLRFLPFDKNTKAPGVNDNGTPTVVTDDSDKSNTSDSALIRVQLLNSPLRYEEQIQATIQPRYHTYLTGTPIVIDTLMYAAGGSGQVTEKQLFIPLSLDSSINMIKIERISGSMKFYEMTVTRY